MTKMSFSSPTLWLAPSSARSRTARVCPPMSMTNSNTKLMSTQLCSLLILCKSSFLVIPTLYFFYRRCCLCGVPMQAVYGSTTCVNCLKSRVDITEGIPRSVQLQHCRECNRYQRPPWVHLEPESPQLLSLCLKHIKGLKRVKLVDASFIWTEPHCKRLKVRITIQKEI